MALGHVAAFFLFGVGDSIDLGRVRGQIEATATIRLSTKPAAPTHLQYHQPPLTIDGHTIGSSDVERDDANMRVLDPRRLRVAAQPSS